MSDNNLNTHSEEELAELVFDIPLQDLSAYQLDKLTELNKLINKAVLEARINTLKAVCNDHAVAPDCFVETQEQIEQLQKELSNENT